jgi:hypothetical protein
MNGTATQLKRSADDNDTGGDSEISKKARTDGTNVCFQQFML